MCRDATGGVPSILHRRSNDEYVPSPHPQVQKQVVEATAEASVEASRGLARAPRIYVASQRGTAPGLFALATKNDDLSWTNEVSAAYGSAADQSTDG